MADEAHVRRRQGDVESLPDEAIATETTTLLNSETSSRTLRNGSPAGSSGRGRDSDGEEDHDAPKQHIGAARAVVLMISVWMLIFLQASNTSGMTMTQSVIAEELKAYEGAMWFTSSYLISMASLAPLFGRLATIFPPRYLVMPLGGCFAVGGVITATAHSFWVLIFGRIVTGMGGAGIMTLSVILVLELVDKKRRGIFVGLVNAGFTIGLSFGAVVYGALLPVIGWRALFGAQTPIGILAGLGAFLTIPKTLSSEQETKAQGRSVTQKLARIDYAGAFALVLTISLFLYGLALFVLIEFKVATDPIIPIAILSSRGVLFSCVAQLFFMSIRWTLLYYTPTFVLAVRGYAPAIAGSILIPTNIGFGSGGLIVGWLHVRRNGAFWLPSVVALSCFAVTMFGLSLTATADGALWTLVAAVVLNGLATGATLNYTLAHLLHLSAPAEHFISTSLLGAPSGASAAASARPSAAACSTAQRREGGADYEADWEPGVVCNGGLVPAEHAIAVERYAGASRGTWQAAAALAVVAVLIQAGTGRTRPVGQKEVDDETEARAALMENEGVGEA
uniref:MFS multidrug transporter n=1 Tax=Colletotrichum fructicola (strain Nara gc5) TaxID=1213859 RepID=L2GAZ9_COLFN